MPANKKYLTRSRWARTSKFLAAFFGGYVTTSALFMGFSVLLNPGIVFWTGSYLAFIIWMALMLLVYQVRRAWVSWIILTGITVVSALVFYLGK